MTPVVTPTTEVEVEAKVVTWFKVDDSLHSHPKAIMAGDAMALWVMAGSWCADQLTDGFVPAYMLGRLGGENATEYAGRLASVGLWDPGMRGSETGWYFHDWAEMQPSRQQVREVRSANAERQRRWREKRRSGARNGERSGDTPDVTSRATDEMTARDTHAATHGATNGASNRTPTRPDPTTTRSVVVGGAGARGNGNDPQETHDPGNEPIDSDERASAIAYARKVAGRGTAGALARAARDRRPTEAHVDTDAGTDPPDAGDIREPGRER